MRPSPDASYDVVVVGGGPAGLSAALVLGRCRRSVLVVDDGQPRNASSHALHGFLTRDGIPPLELLRLGRAELEPYGVHFHYGRATAAHKVDGDGCETESGAGRRRRRPGGFHVTLETGDRVHCRRLLLTTGIRDVLPEIEGMLRYYGRGVYHCPYCDGWEVRDRRLVAFGRPKGATGLALHLLSWSSDVVVCTNGELATPAQASRLKRNGVALIERPIAELRGGEGPEGRLEGLVFQDGERLSADALFLSVPKVQHSTLPEALGCDVDDTGHVRVRGAQHTRVRGLYMAGDGVRDVHFAIVAAAQGARAAVAIQEDLEKEERR